MTNQTPQNRQRTLEQERARFAWACVSRMKTSAGKKEYGQLARGAAADIQINGLGQTLAFWRAKKNNELLSDVSNWLKQQLAFTQPEVIDWIANTASTDDYRRATAEAVAVLIWIKRFSEAELIE